MQTITLPGTAISTQIITKESTVKTAGHNASPGPLEKWFINLAIKVNIFFIAIFWLRNPKKIWKIFFAMLELREKNMGRKYEKALPG